LLSIAFDPGTVRATGAAIEVIDHIGTNSLNGAIQFGLSSNGTLVYLPGQSTSTSMTMLSATRSGRTEVLFDRRLIGTFRISPDGNRLAVSINDAQEDIWLFDLKQRRMSRFTLGAGTESSPVWSPDSTRLYYASDSSGQTKLVAKAAGGGEEVTIHNLALFPTTISADGQLLAGRAITTSSFDVVARRTSGDTPASAIVATDANETSPAFSPAGRYVAFQSDETGRPEIFVQAYPSGGKWQVTTSGGNEPRWTSGGRELVYRNGQTIFAVPIVLQPFSMGTPQTLFSVPNLYAFDVAADGQRFVIATDAENRENVSFTLITGWFEEVKAKMRSSR
jgi:Tol biopolymer transport system component